MSQESATHDKQGTAPEQVEPPAAAGVEETGARGDAAEQVPAETAEADAPADDALSAELSEVDTATAAPALPGVTSQPPPGPFRSGPAPALRGQLEGIAAAVHGAPDVAAPHPGPGASGEQTDVVADPAAVSGAAEPQPLGSLYGPGVWLFGVLLWAYVIIGVYVVAAGVPEVLGWGALLGVVGLRWRSIVAHHRGRGATWVWGPGGLAVGFWLLSVVVVAAVFGSYRERSGNAVTIGMWTLALVAYFVGRSLTDLPKRDVSKGRKVLSVLLWAAGIAASGIAMIATADRL